MGLKTGVERLDKSLKGGLPERTSILLIGPPKSGKSTFGMQFLFQGLSDNEYGVCILTNDFPEDYVKQLGRLGNIDPMLENGLLRFVDCYSIHVGLSKTNTLFIVRVNGPTALNDISISLSQILNSLPATASKRIMIDSISTLLLYNSPKLVLELVQVLNGKAKSKNATMLFLVEDGVHNPSDITTLTSMTDGLFRLKEENKRSTFEIKGFGLQNLELAYTIESGKLKFS